MRYPLRVTASQTALGLAVYLLFAVDYRVSPLGFRIEWLTIDVSSDLQYEITRRRVCHSASCLLWLSCTSVLIPLLGQLLR